MNSLFVKLNLQPQERRLVVAIGLVVFIVINFLLVWPHFGDWKKLKKREGDLEDSLGRYHRLLAQVPSLKKELAKLETQGQTVATEAQALQLQNNVQSPAALSRVSYTSYTPMRGSSGTRTNQLFEEQSGTIAVTTGEAELVDFLYSLSSSNSLIRVLSMTLQPDKDHIHLSGTITLVASYQRASPLKPATATATAKTNAPAPKAASPLAGGGKTNKPNVKSSTPPPRSTNAPPKKF